MKEREASNEEELNEIWEEFIQYTDMVVGKAGLSVSCLHGYLHHLCDAGYAQFAAQHISKSCKAAMRDQYILPHWKLSSSLKECGEQICLESISNERLEEQLASSFQFMQNIEEGCQRYVSILKNLCLAIDSASQRAVSYAYFVPDFKSYTAALIMHEAPIDLTEILRKCYSGSLQSFAQNVAERHWAGPFGSFQELTDGLSDPEEWSFRFADVDQGAHVAYLRNSSSLLAAYPTVRPSRIIAQSLLQLGLEEVSQDAYKKAICCVTGSYLIAITKGELEKPILHEAQSFLDAVILPYLSLLIPQEDGKQARLQFWGKHLQTFVHQTVGSLRIIDIFDIVTSYPDSLEAVSDLQQCMAVCSLQKSLVKVYLTACSTRLHIPGAKTTDIIEFYVHSIKILRELDATGVLLEAVSRPTRQYLQTRKDAIRCIVSAMTDDSAVAGESLYDELHRPAVQDDDDEENETDAFAMEQMKSWVPEPVNADLKHTAKAQRMHDIISMLVHIYGSKDLFINEYRGMLAERLLAKGDFDTDTEIRTLEHLKKRFGENNLHSCEVMMKDLSDSKRLFNTIKVMPDGVRSPVRGKQASSGRGIGPASATIISAHFWPPLQAEALALDPQVDDYLNEYAAKFWVAKQPRKLVWMKHLGTVELSLKVHGISRDFTVSPFEASILMLFKRKATWPEAALAKELGTSVEVLRRKIGFWVKHGVLIERLDRTGNGHQYIRTNQLAARESGGEVATIAMDEDEGESALVSQEEQLKQEMAVYEQYIMGMLSTFETGLQLDRIHNMLKMFVPEQAYDKTEEQLSEFIGQLVTEEKLVMAGNVFMKR